MMISRDIEFNEDEERYKDHQKPIITPLQTPMSSTSPSLLLSPCYM